jgi:hypothetical protein
MIRHPPSLDETVSPAGIMFNSFEKSDRAKTFHMNLSGGKEMQLSKLIARMASVIYLSASPGAFFSADYYGKIANDLFSNAGLIYVTGFITVIILGLAQQVYLRFERSRDPAGCRSATNLFCCLPKTIFLRLIQSQNLIEVKLRHARKLKA